MKEKKVPKRKCLGCFEKKEKKDLIRIVKSPCDNETMRSERIRLDLTNKAPGRGAYICRDPQCLMKAKKARRLEKAFRCKIPDEIYENLEKELTVGAG